MKFVRNVDVEGGNKRYFEKENDDIFGWFCDLKYKRLKHKNLILVS